MASMSLSIAEKLPNGLWNFIFSKIKDPPDYLALRQVNKKLYDISKDPISTSRLVLTFNILFKAWKYGTWSIIQKCTVLDNPALCAAISYGHSKIVELLISRGADIHYAKELPTKTAIEYARYDILESLLSLDVDVNYDKGRLLFIAVSKKDLRSIKILLNKGADPNLDHSVLFEAVNLNQIDIVKLLLEFKANPDGKNPFSTNNVRPIYHAYKFKQYEIAELLLIYGANPNYSDDSTSELLPSAVSRNDEIMFNQLIKYGADVSINNYSAVTMAITYNRFNMIFQLLSLGVDLHTYYIESAISMNSHNQVSSLLLSIMYK